MGTIKAPHPLPAFRKHRLRSDNVTLTEADLCYLNQVMKRTNSYPEEITREMLASETVAARNGEAGGLAMHSETAIHAEEDEVRYWRSQKQHKLTTTDRGHVELALIKLSIAERDEHQLLKLLSKANNSANSVDQDGKMPIHYAAMYGDIEILKMLIQHTCDVNTLSKDGRSALEYAVKAGHFDLAKFLIDQGAQVESIVDGMPSSSRSNKRKKFLSARPKSFAQLSAAKDGSACSDEKLMTKGNFKAKSYPNLCTDAES